MRSTALLSCAALGALMLAAPGHAQTYDSRQIEIRDVIGAVEVRTSDRSDISVRINSGAGVVDAPGVELDDGVVVISASRRVRDRNCRGDSDDPQIQIRGDRWRSLDEFPSVIIDAPRGVDLTLDGGIVFGEAGDLGEGDIRIDSCGDFDLASASGAARLQINGSGDMRAGSLGSAALIINGSGDIEAGAVGGDLEIEVNGSGDISADSADGALSVSVRGSGDVDVDAGRGEPFTVSIHGSGDVRFGGVAVNPRVTVFGSGDIWIGSMEGSLSSSGMGSGDIHVGG